MLAIEVDRYEGVPGYESWWDVPVSEVSEAEAVNAARAAYEEALGLTEDEPVRRDRKKKPLLPWFCNPLG